MHDEDTASPEGDGEVACAPAKVKKPKAPPKPKKPPKPPAPAGAGPSFLAEALRISEWDEENPSPDAAEEIRAAVDHLYDNALHSEGFQIPVLMKGRDFPVAFVRGGLLGRSPENDKYARPGVRGPREADVLILDKIAQPGDVQRGAFLRDKISAPFWRALDEAGIPEDEYSQWFATSVVRFPHPSPAGGTVPVGWMHDCAPLLAKEIAAARPKVMGLLGADATKAVLGKDAKFSMLQGQVVDHVLADGTPCRVVPLKGIQEVSGNPESYPELVDGLRLLKGALRGDASFAREVAWEAIDDAGRLAQVVDSILADPDPECRIVALDGEWHGERPGEPGSYLRTIQFSARPHEAFVVVLRHAGGGDAFFPTEAAAIEQLNRLCKSTPGRESRVGGHWFRADLPWLIHAGLDLRPEYKAARTPAGTKHYGGWDTGLMLHALFEHVKGRPLEEWCVKLLGYPRWDEPLDEAIKAILKQKGIKKSQLGGYGDIPDEVLFPYSAYDAAATRALVALCNGVAGADGLLDRDDYGLNSRTGYWSKQSASLAFLEMEREGLLIDQDRAAELTAAFMDTRNDALEAFRKQISWPEFNIKSTEMCRELLFGEALNGKPPDPKTGEPIRLRPEGVETLGLTPVTAVGGKPWEEIVERDLDDVYNVAVDKQTLGILGNENQVVKDLLDVRYLAQVTTSLLRPPVHKDGVALFTPDGRPIYDGGLLSHAGVDLRIRSHFFPVETGRYASSRPNLQNIGAKRGKDYKRLLKDRYFPLRSIFKASPGHVLLGVDLKAAEIAISAWMCNDPAMLRDVTRNNLPEKHPDYLDLHSQTAVNAFQLDCPPSKDGLEKAGKSDLRTAAKNVTFGVFYGRGSQAIMLQCHSEGAMAVTAEDAERVKTGLFSAYPMLSTYFDSCRDRVTSPGWMQGLFGNYRRFPRSLDRKGLSDAQRSAMNFPIQGGVAGAVDAYCTYLTDFQASHRGPESFRLVLQLHDAIYFEVPIPHIEWLDKEVLPAMVRAVPIWPRDHDGRWLGTGPYYFGLDAGVYLNWEEKIPMARGLELGIPPKYCSSK